MCRLFGALSLDPISAGPLLNQGQQSLLAQSKADRKRLQSDGWGVGWFERGWPKILKSSQAIYRDPVRLERAATSVRGNCLVGHARWASNPLRLSKAELIGQAHTQPFVHGRWLFAHNGTLYIPREVTAELGSWARFLQGKNDSEVLFYWLLKHLKLSSATACELSLKKALQGLEAIWKSCRKRHALYKHPYHGLNFVLTDGKTLVAFCWVNAGGFGRSQALCHRGQPYYQLQFRATAQELLVASEPLDQRWDWQALRHGDLLFARQNRARLRWRRKLTAPSKIPKMSGYG